ncbi:MAG: ABC transporter ATP-binding protein [Gemmatimonadales bacterium]
MSLALEPGRLVGVAGPNGSGKSTLLGALTGHLEPTAGSVLLDGRPIRDWAPRDRAARIGVVSQREEYPFAWRVSELVGFGRYARLEPLAGLGSHDRAVIARSMERADVLALADRRIDTLSGGEWQRVRSPGRWPRRRRFWCWTNQPRRSIWATKWRSSS